VTFNCLLTMYMWWVKNNQKYKFIPKSSLSSLVWLFNWKLKVYVLCKMLLSTSWFDVRYIWTSIYISYLHYLHCSVSNLKRNFVQSLSPVSNVSVIASPKPLLYWSEQWFFENLMIFEWGNLKEKNVYHNYGTYFFPVTYSFQRLFSIPS